MSKKIVVYKSFIFLFPRTFLKNFAPDSIGLDVWRMPHKECFDQSFALIASVSFS